MKAEETIKAEEIDGYRGADDLESLLQFIESKPKSIDNDQSGSSKPSSSSNAKWKRSRRGPDAKSKRSRTPSVTTPSKEKSPELSSLPSQKTSRAASRQRNPESNDNAANNDHHHTSSAMNSRNSSVTRSKDPESGSCMTTTHPDSVTTVKNSLIAITNAANKKTLKKPKKQAGWLVDFNNESNSKNARVKAKPPSGKAPEQQQQQPQKKESSVLTNDQDSSEEQISVQDEIIACPEPEVAAVHEDEAAIIIEAESSVDIDKINPKAVLFTKSQKPEENVCINYESILKFIKKGM